MSPNDFDIGYDSTPDGIPEQGQDFLPATTGVAQFVVDSAKLPVHMQHLPRGGSIEQSIEAMRMFSEYVETPTTALKTLAGQIIEVVGAIIYEQGPYKSKDLIDMPGYYEVRLKLAESHEVKLRHGDEVKRVQHHTIARTSGKRVAELIVGLVSQLGWYDWPGSILFEVGVDDKNGAIYLRMV